MHPKQNDLKKSLMNGQIMKMALLLGFVGAVATSVPSIGVAAPKKATCEGLFQEISTPTARAEKTEASVAPVAAKPAAKAPAKPAASESIAAIGLTETITNIFGGSQLYTVVHGTSGTVNSQGNLPGLYRRDQREWKMLLPGQVSMDANGSPVVHQLALSRSAKKTYAITAVDGEIYLISNLSDPAVPESIIHFGSNASPLYEVGSMQKRFLPRADGKAKVSVFQETLSVARGSAAQLIMISMRYSQPQATGDGITFAFEVQANDDKKLSLSGKPIVLDYKYHESEAMRGMLTTRPNTYEKVLYSKILIEQFANSDFTIFGEHMPNIQKFATTLAGQISNAAMSAGLIKMPNEVVGYNITTGRVERDIKFANQVFGNSFATIEQNYYLTRGRAEVVVHTGRPAGEHDVRLEGTIDLVKGKTWAIWQGADGREIIFSKDGVLYGLLHPHENADRLILVELGRPSELFSRSSLDAGLPQELNFQTFMPTTTKQIETGFVAITGLSHSNQPFTGVVRLNLLMSNTLRKIDGFKVLNYALSMQELGERIKRDDAKDILFDSVTPKSPSIPAYRQAYDPSKPHLNVLETEPGRPVYKFKQPSTTLTIYDGVTLAEFSEVPGVENPSGLYFNLKPEKITGNESKLRVLGQLLPRPGSVAEEHSPEKQYVFAKIDASYKKKDETAGIDDDDFDTNPLPVSKRRAMLLAVDAAKQSGKTGYQFIFALEDLKGNFHHEPVPGFGRTSWLSNLSYFNHATILQGRGKDRDGIYLFLSLSAAEEGVSVIYRYSLEKPDETPKMVQLKMVLSERDIHDRVGFDENGVPNFVLTPELHEEAHNFAVFDLRKAQKVLPNQGGTGAKRKIIFGDVKMDASGDANFVSQKDTWHTFAYDVRRTYPQLGRSAELAQFDSFIALKKQLDGMTDAKKPAERMILVVPEALRDLVWDFVLNAAFKGEKDTGPGAVTNQAPNKFSHLNRHVVFNIIDRERTHQEQYFANMQNWARQKTTRPNDRHFLLARLDAISQPYTPEPREHGGFQLEYVDAGSRDDLSQISASTSHHLPSALYLLAAEKPVSFKEFRHLNEEPSASMLIVATPEEMADYEKLAEREVENGLLNHFRIQEIKNPDDHSMAVSLAEIFRLPEVQSLEFQFSAKEIKQRAVLDAQQSFEVVIDYAVSRFTSLIAAKKESRFESFMRFRAAFAQAVLSDKEVRRTRIVNKHFIERVLTQVFDIPMNLQELPADDPMVILSRQDAMIAWANAGYSGSFDLKAKVRDVVVSQTRNTGRAIPSSVILFGNTGSGKTYMFKTLVKMLRLKLWDFNPSANNTDAQAIIINVGQLKDKGGSQRDGDMDVDTVLTHLNKLLAMPNGYRAWILFDDVHAASNEVKAKILQWQRSIFESPDGMYTAMRGETLIRRPIRNLNIFMTLNPTPDQDQIAKYARDKSHPTTEEILLATVSSPTYKVEPSFLKRYGLIVNLDFMPAGAKGPELLKKLSESSNSLLNTMNRIMLVDPKVVERLVEENEKVDARTFLSSSTNAFIEAASSERVKGSLVLVVPAMSRYSVPGSPLIVSNDSDQAAERISRWVNQNTRTLALDSSVDGNLAFLKLIVDAFRMPIYESFTLALQEDVRFAADPVLQRTMLAPVLAAISDHISQHAYMSVNDLNVNASDFGFHTPNEREMFRAAVSKLVQDKAKPLFPDAFKQIDAIASTWQNVEGNGGEQPANTRKQVLSDLITKNRVIFEQKLREILRVDDLDSLPDPTTWTGKLSADKTVDPKVAGRALAGGLWDFLPRILDDELMESHVPGAPELTVYAATRLYLYTIDRAISQMQWARPSRFLLKALDVITLDQVMSQKPGVQSFLFTDPNRLIKPSIPDFTFQVISSSHALNTIPKEARERQRIKFDHDVNKYFSRTEN